MSRLVEKLKEWESVVGENKGDKVLELLDDFVALKKEGYDVSYNLLMQIVKSKRLLNQKDC